MYGLSTSLESGQLKRSQINIELNLFVTFDILFFRFISLLKLPLSSIRREKVTVLRDKENAYVDYLANVLRNKLFHLKYHQNKRPSTSKKRVTANKMYSIQKWRPVPSTNGEAMQKNKRNYSGRPPNMHPSCSADVCRCECIY